jgi:hypothetical protein
MFGGLDSAAFPKEIIAVNATPIMYTLRDGKKFCINDVKWFLLEQCQLIKCCRGTVSDMKRNIRKWFARHTAIIGLLGACGCASPQLIRPGAPWLDNRGQEIQAHGGGVLQMGRTYYWFGEDRSRDNDPEYRYVACYSSKDLAHWNFRGQVVKLADPEDLGRGWVLERPKVFYNGKTKKFVMYAHIDGKGGYQFARAAVFTCDTVDGHYEYLKNFRPLGHESRDIGQFIDDDGSAYLIFEDRPFGFRIGKLSDDYLTVEREVCLVPEHLEGGAVVHFDGLYYAVGSRLSGWSPNPNQYATSTSLAGPWSKFKDIAPPESNTYDSQSSMLLKVTGAGKTTVIFLGDIWKPDAQWDSRYLWMPLEIGGGKLWLRKPTDWTLNIRTAEAALQNQRLLH